MCGIVGFFSVRAGEWGEATLRGMSDRIAHRGPDDDGAFFDPARGVALGHRRLSIIDLSSAGHQPMRSASGRFVIVFNGEIYNHQTLRGSLESAERAPCWRGHSDTETLLAGFDAWGIRPTLEQAIGMFALAVWDNRTNELILARDRIGEKPLYYGWQGDVFLFASELKALHGHPAFCGTVDRGALSLFFRHNCIPAPYSIFKGISKLSPGTLLTVSLAQREPSIVEYWSGSRVAKAGVSSRYSGTPEQAVDELEGLLKDAIRQQMLADVPLGAFLSGGVDSSAIVALMQAQSSRSVKTFTIGFQEDGYNEAVHAKAVAQHLGTDHTELYVTPNDAMGVIPRLPELYDEPFADSSQIPTFLVSEMARKHVTVSLSGDAGDELFCGYNRYVLTAGLWRKLAAVPIPLRRVVAKGLTSVSPHAWSRIFGALDSVLPKSARLSLVGEKLHKGASVLASPSVDALYRGLVSHWDSPCTVVIGGKEPVTLLTERAPALGGMGAVERMMALDSLTYLPDDILTKVDRAAMGVSLETRVPFLDHRVVEFASRLPLDYKLREGQSKWVLRQVVYRYVPKALIERPKMGFGVPIDAWLRGPLRDWAESLLDPSRLRREGFLRPEPVRALWDEHLSGARNWQHHLWDVLMFQAWNERWAGSPD
jgi:asparagine synthase (glutamine-hydrolysing)